jgi:hypothetical protein
MEYKKCQHCGKDFAKPHTCSKKAWLKRKFCSFSCNARFYKLGDTNKGKFGDKSSVWTGDKIQKDSLHCWVAREWGSPRKCDICGTEESPKFEWANKYHTYKRNREDWQRLCKKCHLQYDIENNGYIHNWSKQYGQFTRNKTY